MSFADSCPLLPALRLRYPPPVLKSHRVVLQPTPMQEALFGQHAGYAYNWTVGEFRAGLEVGEWLPERTLRPQWNVAKGILAHWGHELSQNATEYAVIDLGEAAERWGARRLG